MEHLKEAWRTYKLRRNEEDERRNRVRQERLNRLRRFVEQQLGLTISVAVAQPCMVYVECILPEDLWLDDEWVVPAQTLRFIPDGDHVRLAHGGGIIHNVEELVLKLARFRGAKA